MSTYRDDRDERIAQLESENAKLRGGALSALDWIAVVVTGAGVATLCTWAYLSRSFAGMYRDFGAALPLLTRVALSPLAGPLSAIAPLVLLVGAGRSTASLANRRRAIVIAFVLVVSALGVYGYAAYLPIFAMASHVR